MCWCWCSFSILALFSAEYSALDESLIGLPITPSDARDERTYVSIWAEDDDAVSFAAIAAAADLGSSSMWLDFSGKGTCRV